MWSKCGSARKASRRNSFSPQPVSGVASPSSRARMPFARREATRLARVSRRVTRCPAVSTSPVAACARASKAGMSAGSFCPSPSSVAIQVPLAARTPVTIAALCPQLVRWRRTTSGAVDAASARRWGVSSVLPSST